ncbi:MAG: hypothetical protein BWY58_00899 [Chloroflexi bacterium ADurb.Bin344]|nr:MAG: hypothetical protein BWY58_00899 [Chloroflexi bacterium ADurb.Bin344]
MADLGVTARSQSSGGFIPDTDPLGCFGSQQSLRIRIDRDKLQILHSLLDHAINRIASRPADADNLNSCKTFTVILIIVFHFFLFFPLLTIPLHSILTSDDLLRTLSYSFHGIKNFSSGRFCPSLSRQKISCKFFDFIHRVADIFLLRLPSHRFLHHHRPVKQPDTR